MKLNNNKIFLYKYYLNLDNSKLYKFQKKLIKINGKI
jgi:hypothetical protein